MRRRHRSPRLLLPLAILAPLLWLLIGCLYIPWFEHPAANNGSSVDFRPLLADRRHVNRPVHFGMTRHQVIQLLGAPRFAAVDRSAFLYEFRTTNGFWVWPLCGFAQPGNERTYVAELGFDSAGVLRSIDVTDEDRPIPPSLYSTAPPQVVVLSDTLKRYQKTSTPMGWVVRVPRDGPWQIIVPLPPSSRPTRPSLWFPATRPTTMPRIVPLEP